VTDRKPIIESGEEPTLIDAAHPRGVSALVEITVSERVHALW